MIDQEWLNKVYVAFKEYEKVNGSQPQAYSFVNWLYKQYGIVLPERK